ncbi:MAG: tetratricopeptide repeat protein, partial [Nitrososphaera sp.]|nr:tetratricopeptide repeat protein [Nitrososphaera sp.]
VVLPYLSEALELFGREHFGTGRVLDTRGMIYAKRDSFHAAREFYEQAIESKRRFNDEAGIALSLGQLGRLYLDWGNLDKAEEYFKADLEIVLRISDERSEAQMYNQLGRVALVRGQLEDAALWLDESIRRSRQGRWSIIEGYAHKDRALVYLAEGRIGDAEAQLHKAEDLFKAAEYDKGIMQVNTMRGIAWRKLGYYDEAERVLHEALEYFQAHGEHPEVARTQLEIARTLNTRNKPRSLVTETLMHALESAQSCRRDLLVQEIEEELKTVNETAYCRHAYQCVRGHDIDEDTISLLKGIRGETTIMAVSLQGFISYTRSRDPEVVLMMLNQMMAELSGVLERYETSVNTYLGDSFIAVLRGANHAQHAVEAGLDLATALADFNRPRRVLDLPLLKVYIGISTGRVFLGNVGTYHMMNFTAVGPAVDLATSLQAESEPGFPCISRTTYEQVQDHFVFKESNPRTIFPKRLGEQQVWDVVKRKRS